MFFIGITNVEDPKLHARNVFLDNGRERCSAEILSQLARRTNDDDARSALSCIRLQDNWKAKLVPLHERFRLLQSVIRRSFSHEHRYRQERTSVLQLLEDFVFRFAHESACRHRGISRGEQRKAPKAESEI